MRRLLVPALCTLLVGCSLVGCSNEPPTGTVAGEVTLDGQPLAQGSIQFTPQAADAATSGAEIKDGKFTATMPVTKMRVEINANKVVGKRKVYETPNSPEVDVVEEIIPQKYNVRSELSIDVQKGSQTARFELQSK